MTRKRPKITPADVKVADASRRRLLKLPAPSCNTDEIGDLSQKRSF
jgi:hypothetical protein